MRHTGAGTPGPEMVSAEPMLVVSSTVAARYALLRVLG